MYSKDEIKEVVNKFETGLNELSIQYQDNINNILNSNDLTKEGKDKKEEEEYRVFTIANKNIVNKYDNKIKEMLDSRLKSTKEKLEQQKDLKLDEVLSPTDISYIDFLIKNGSNEDLKEVAEKYNYNPYVLKMINLRDSDKKINERFIINNPLEDVLNEKYIDYVSFSTNVINRRSKLWD